MKGTKKLVIVESPTKAKTIGAYLGDDYEVIASVGHIRDLAEPSELPPELKKGPFGKFAVDVDHDLAPYASARAAALLLEFGGGHYVGMTAVAAGQSVRVIDLAATEPGDVAGMAIDDGMDVADTAPGPEARYASRSDAVTSLIPHLGAVVTCRVPQLATCGNPQVAP